MLDFLCGKRSIIREVRNKVLKKEGIDVHKNEVKPKAEKGWDKQCKIN